MSKAQFAIAAAIAIVACACGKTDGKAPAKKDGVGVEQATNNLVQSPATTKPISAQVTTAKQTTQFEQHGATIPPAGFQKLEGAGGSGSAGAQEASGH